LAWAARGLQPAARAAQFLGELTGGHAVDMLKFNPFWCCWHFLIVGI